MVKCTATTRGLPLGLSRKINLANDTHTHGPEGKDLMDGLREMVIPAA